MDPEIIDEATAVAALNRVRDDLLAAQRNDRDDTDHLKSLIVDIRPRGLLSVDQMATAVGRQRNYIDSVWSAHGDTTRGRQTRVPVTHGEDTKKARKAFDSLAVATSNASRSADKHRLARAERNRVVTMVYASGILGPSAIAAAVGIDRNHVLRIARDGGAAPAHRPNARNQYSAVAK